MQIKINNGKPAILNKSNPTAEEENILQNRAQRNSLLQESDKYMIEDYPTAKKVEWKTYRESLRDMDFSDPDNITWPTKPKEAE